KAEDQCTLNGRPNVGLGERYVLEVVTPQQLQAMLQARELLQRQKFETIIDELTATRDLLAKTEVAGAKRTPPADGTSDGPLPGAEPGDTAGDKPADSSTEAAGGSPTAEELEEQRVSLMLALERCAENIERSSYETKMIAEGFLAIREEISNNRIDNPTEQKRLKDEI